MKQEACSEPCILKSLFDQESTDTEKSCTDKNVEKIEKAVDGKVYKFKELVNKISQLILGDKILNNKNSFYCDSMLQGKYGVLGNKM